MNWLFGSFREWALPARRRKESKSPFVGGVFAVQPSCQETVPLWPERDGSVAEIIRRTEPTGVEFIAEPRSAALRLAFEPAAGAQAIEVPVQIQPQQIAGPVRWPTRLARRRALKAERGQIELVDERI